MEEQNFQAETRHEHRHGSFSAREQERGDRHMAKQMTREARRTARAQRPRHNWTFEIKAGEKLYTFTWRWGSEEPQPLGEDEAKSTSTNGGIETQSEAPGVSL